MAGSTTRVCVISDAADRLGFPGSVPERLASSCLLTGGRGNRLARVCALLLRPLVTGHAARARASYQFMAEKAGER